MARRLVRLALLASVALSRPSSAAGSLPETGSAALVGTPLAHTRVVTAAKWCPGRTPPPPPPPPVAPALAMRPCNASDPAQRWTLASDGAISPASTGELCLTRTGAHPALPLSLLKCRGSAGRLGKSDLSAGRGFLGKF